MQSVTCLCPQSLDIRAQRNELAEQAAAQGTELRLLQSQVPHQDGTLHALCTCCGHVSPGSCPYSFAPRASSPRGPALGSGAHEGSLAADREHRRWPI